MISLEELKNLIKKEYDNYEEIIEGLFSKRLNSFRINTLKISVEDCLKKLDEENISYIKTDISKYSFQTRVDNKTLMNLSLFKNGEIYLQSLSSQLPPLYLDLNDDYDVLDMCAAPGGKTSFISMLNPRLRILAIENDKIRFDRLNYNLEHLLCKNCNTMKADAKKLDSFYRFDSILLDAPCSGSGTINKEKDLEKFSYKLVLNSSKLQKELLKKALEILKPGKSMIYSTCSILKEENEDVLKQVLSKKYVLEPLDIKAPTLKSTLDNTYTIKPSQEYEGFFIAKIRRIG